MKTCVLDDNKICDNCGECNRCDLDPGKICDNCCKCIEQLKDGKEYQEIPVADVVLQDDKEYLEAYFQNDSEESDAEEIAYEQIDPELLAYWENKLKEQELQERAENQQPHLYGVRKKRIRTE